MSWNVRVEATESELRAIDGSHIDKAIDGMKLSDSPWNDETKEQFAAAKVAAKALIASGALGYVLPGMRFQISLGGHANLQHELTPGWGNDSISVYVTRMADEEPEPPESATEASETPR